jgi:hypothetical protein
MKKVCCNTTISAIVSSIFNVTNTLICYYHYCVWFELHSVEHLQRFQVNTRAPLCSTSSTINSNVR